MANCAPIEGQASLSHLQPKFLELVHGSALKILVLLLGMLRDRGGSPIRDDAPPFQRAIGIKQSMFC